MKGTIEQVGKFQGDCGFVSKEFADAVIQEEKDHIAETEIGKKLKVYFYVYDDIGFVILLDDDPDNDGAEWLPTCDLRTLLQCGDWDYFNDLFGKKSYDLADQLLKWLDGLDHHGELYHGLDEDEESEDA